MRIRLLVMVVVIVVGVLVQSREASAGTILYSNLLANPGFEIGGGLGVCPTSWTCGGSPAPGFDSYAPTNAEYVPGSDGLPGSKSVPDGSKVGSSPTGVSANGGAGTGTLSQLGLGTYALNTTYELDLYVGTPLVEPGNPTLAAAPVGSIKLDFLGNGLTIASVNATPTATPGQWVLQTFTLTPGSAQIGESIGLEIEVTGNSAGNGVADFDIPAPATTAPVPEPATLMLTGIGLAGITRYRRRASHRNRSEGFHTAQ